MRITLNNIAFLLVIVGALNWGLVGAANINLVADLFGAFSIISRAIYLLVGVSGVYLALARFTTMTVNNPNL